jgi:hypothetical protein
MIFVKVSNEIQFKWLESWLKGKGYDWPNHPNRPHQKYTRFGEVQYGDYISGIQIYPERQLMYMLGDSNQHFDLDLNQDSYEQMKFNMETAGV